MNEKLTTQAERRGAAPTQQAGNDKRRVRSSEWLGDVKPKYTHKQSFALDGKRVTKESLAKAFVDYLQSSITHFSSDGRIVWTLQAAVYPHTHKTRKASKPNSPPQFLPAPNN